MAQSHHDELEKLEALYAQHPEGRVFMHLAEAYRKAGEVERARELLEEGMARYPDYASAHVVLGRVQLDRGEAAQAQTAFRRVLELDPQNMVALRALGDLAEREERMGDALEYFRELQALEPTDEELEDRIAALEADQAGDGPPGPAPEAGVAAEADGAPDAESDEADHRDAGESELAGEFQPTSLDPEPGSGDEGEAVDGTVAPVAGFEPTREAEPPEEAARAAEAGPPSGPDAPPEGEPARPEASEFAPPPGEPASGAEVAGDDDVVELTDVVEQAGADDAQPGDDERPVVTETMADIYARQGLYDRAAEVYRQLLGKRPDDARLATRLEEMEQKAREAERTTETPSAEQAGTPGIPDDAWLVGDEDYADDDATGAEPRSVDAESVEAAWTAGAGFAGGEVTPYAWADEETKAPPAEPSGVTVGEYFRELLAWSPTRPEPAPGGSEPSQPSPSSAPADVGGGSAADETDRLFGDAGAPGAGAAGGTDAAAGADDAVDSPAEASMDDSPVRESGDEAADEDDDLEAFREWLQNLKR